MGQLNQTVLYYNDSAGAILPGTRHFFYEGGTTTDKAVFSDPGLTPGNELSQPVVSDSNGILPQIWLQSGTYRWVGEDANANQLFDRDDINFSESVINTVSPFVFKTQNDMVLGIAANGISVSLQVDQTAYTQGQNNQTDGLGLEFLILAADSGGDILLGNGNWAHAQDNFATSALIDSKIATHNSSGTAHSDIRTLVTNNTTAIGTNTTNIGTNTTNIGTNTTNIGTNATNIGTNTTNIGTNTTNIGTNTTDIATNTSQLDTLKYFSFRVDSTDISGSNITNLVQSIDGVEGTTFTISATARYTFNLTHTIDVTAITAIPGQINRALSIAGTEPGDTASFVFVIATDLGTTVSNPAEAVSDIIVTVWYSGTPV